jgi:hypothetical protein
LRPSGNKATEAKVAVLALATLDDAALGKIVERNLIDAEKLL